MLDSSKNRARPIVLQTENSTVPLSAATSILDHARLLQEPHEARNSSSLITEGTFDHILTASCALFAESTLTKTEKGDLRDISFHFHKQ
jgi:hypothetical protein